MIAVNLQILFILSKNYKMKRINKTILILTFLFFFSPLKALGIAQVIEPIFIENTLRGEEYEKNITVFNTEDKEIKVNLTAIGDIKEWTVFFEPEDLKIPIENIIIPPKSNKIVIVKFLISQDAPNKTYLGKIVASTSPQKSEGEDTSVTLIQKVPREVSIKVTDKEIIDCEVRILPRNFSLKINEPFKINIVYHNTGNVRIEPSIQQKILKNEETIFNAIFPYPENKGGIKPGYSETIPIEWQTTGQEKGEYQAEIKVLINDEIMGENDFNFTIGDVGVVAGAEDSKADKLFKFLSTIGGSNPVKGWFIIGGAFLIIAQVLIIFNRKKREKV